MEGLDLNIHNYDLNDLLNLFKMPYHFKEDDLKMAKKIVLKTHPDKSGLDKEYFLFFSQAYKYLLKIHHLRQSSTTTNSEYQKDDLWSKEHSILIDGKIKTMSQKEYTEWFNRTFEKMRIKDDSEETGYGDWLKSDDDLNNIKAKNMNEFNRIFKKKKQEGRELILHQKVNELVFTGGGSMIDDSESVYSSDVFSKLKYEDLKRAHVETVVPVTEEDFTSKKRFDSVEKYIRYRDSQKGNPLAMDKSKNILHDKSLQNEKLSSQRAYNLLQEDRVMKERNKSWWKNLKLLNG